MATPYECLGLMGYLNQIGNLFWGLQGFFGFSERIGLLNGIMSINISSNINKNHGGFSAK
ncbi:MAG: hypothetical protein ACKOS8_11160 [Gemmataceae bacterium]